MFRILAVVAVMTIGAPAMGKPAEMPPSRLRMTEPSEDEVRAARPGGAEMEQMINSFIEGDGPGFDKAFEAYHKKKGTNPADNPYLKD